MTTSGVGVTIAAIIKLTSRAYFLLRRNKDVFTTPILLRKTINTGSSKTIPKAISNRKESEKYSLTAGRGSRISLAYPVRNLKAGGKTTKYPKAAPPIKQRVDITVKGSSIRFS